jgi:hypothetical protein
MAEMRAWQKQMKTCLQKIDACLKSKEPTPEETANAGADLEVPNEQATVETIGALKDLYGDHHLAIGRCWQLTKQTRAMVGPGRSWPLPADGWPAVLLLHRTRDSIIRDQARTVLYAEPLRNRLSRRDVGPSRNATMAEETEAWNSSYAREARRHFMRPLGKPSGWRLGSAPLGLPWGFEKRVLGHCGGAGHHPSERRGY